MSKADAIEGYDVIGDIHGHSGELLALLEQLGYQHDGQSYRHDTRQVLFLGDFIDRGPGQRIVLQTVMAMCKSGNARAIMGNHEFNALAYHTEHPAGSDQWLRPRSDKNTRQHRAFLDAYGATPGDLREVLDWFMTLPLWLELPGGLRLVHACWHEPSMQHLQALLGNGNTLTPGLLIQASDSNSAVFRAVEIVLKGVELPLPDGKAFADKDAIERRDIRIKWWLNNTRFYGDVSIPPYVAKTLPELHELPLPDDLVIGYDEQEVPVLFGHYWFEGDVTPQTANVACLDYSVPRESGKLVAYRWSGEQALSAENFTSVANMTGSY